MTRVVIVGAGLGGLVTGAMLARAGLDVTILEAHIYPGGCAGTFYHQGYRFDAGATLPAGFEPGGVMQGLGEALNIEWGARPASEAMVVHLADGMTVTQWTDPAAWRATRMAAFGAAAEDFWHWQESTAEALWNVAQKGVPWPPANARELNAMVRAGWALAARQPRQLPGLAADGLRNVAAHLPAGAPSLRQFVDAQLLISAQATAGRANALYGAAALDLPRRGVAHLLGGMSELGQHLAEALRRQGGQIHYRQRVNRVLHGREYAWHVETNKGMDLPADVVIFNLPPWNAEALIDIGTSIRRELHDDRLSHSSAGAGTTEVATTDKKVRVPVDGWGAFILYAGLDEKSVPAGFPLHHQIVMREPLGEGNSVFLSLSLPEDTSRAPAGRRTVTVSTHTALRPWWDLFAHDRPAYEARKVIWAERVWDALARVLPGARAAAEPTLMGTPVTFQRFTQRSLGWVGGFPQTSLGRARQPRLGNGLWLVGDSIFPGQSTLAVTLGGLRVAEAVLAEKTQAAHRHQTWWAKSSRRVGDRGTS